MDIWTERLDRAHLPLLAQWLARREGALTPSDLPADCAGLSDWFEAQAAEPERQDFLALVYETPVGLAGLRGCGGNSGTAELWVLLGEVGYNLERTATFVTLRMLDRAFFEVGYEQVLVWVYACHGWFLELLERMGFTRAAEQDGMICLLVGKAVFLNRKYLF